MNKELKLLIVDDEKWERDLLTHLVTQKFSSLFKIELAKNGQEAVDQCKIGRFDIIIMDINMPLLDGLAAMKKIKEMDPETAFIILTAYGEFEYAQRAIDLGASGYLLKPVEPEPLYEKVQNLYENWIVKQENIKKMNELEKAVHQISPYMKDLFFQALLFSQFNRTAEIEEFRGLCGIPFIPKRIAVAMIPKEERRWNFPSSPEEMDVLAMEGKLVLFSHEKFDYDKFSDDWEKENGFSLQLGVGSVCSTPVHIHSSFVEAQQAQAFIALLDEGGILYYEDLKQLLNDQSYTGYVNSKQLIAEIKGANIQGAVREIDKIFREVIPKPLNVIKSFSMELLFLFTEYMYESDFEETKVSKYREHYYARMMQMTHPGEIVDYMKEFVGNMIEDIQQRPKNHQEQIVVYCKEYIKGHYMQEIDLNVLAKELHVNPNYISKLFKRIVGVNLVDYINNFRIQRARGLLEHTTASIEEIATQVGFNSHKYFSYVFKKYLNLSPSQYRVRAAKGEKQHEYDYSLDR